MELTTRLLGSNCQYSRFPAADFYAAMGALGVKRLDLVPQPPFLWCSHIELEDPSHRREELARNLLSVEVLTPLPYRYSITAPAGAQRTATLAYYKNCLTLARALHARFLVLGAAGACWDTDKAVLLARAAALLRELSQAAEEKGITLLLCPVMGGDTPLMAEAPVLGRAAELSQLLEVVSSPALAAALDTNVMSACGETIAQWFDALGDRIRLVRLADGNYHGYRAWGEGCLPCRRCLDALAAEGYQGDFSLLLPGERYLEDPFRADKITFAALERS